MNHFLSFDANGFNDYRYWQGKDKKVTRRINELILSIQRDGLLEGKGKAEVLKGDYKGCYSRRIDDKNRLIYQVSSNGESKQTFVLSCREHYPKNISPESKKLLQGLHIFN